jgi:hypothetical protein
MNAPRSGLALVALLVLLVACSSASERGADGGAAQACVQDAALGGPYAMLDGGSNERGCPAEWADLSDGGYPSECTTNRLICVYPQGQAECAPDGPVLKWAQNGMEPGCTELPPALCSPCAMPGSVCEYITGPPPLVTDFVTTLCCDGNTHRWDIQPGGGCPNGNTCGTISASDYDQTCAKDSDCTGVTDGNLCSHICTNCIDATINVRAVAQYNADFAKKVSEPGVCPCPLGPTPVCNAGKCGFRQ